MPPQHADIADNLMRVRRRLDAAAQRAGRDASNITLVAVSKTFPPESVRAAVAVGQRVFGENRVQEAAAKIDALADLGLEWHLIGHLQSNKARKAVAVFPWIESVDSLPLLERLDASAAGAPTRPSILIQVDLAREASKHGADEAATRPLVSAAAAARHLDLRGLMIVPPYPENPEDSRPWFRRLRALRDHLVSEGLPADRLRELSMGMSHDFEVAIEEGATLVRVGTAIFGQRPPVTPASAEPAVP
jgi:hypothetical protein